MENEKLHELERQIKAVRQEISSLTSLVQILLSNVNSQSSITNKIYKAVKSDA